MAREVDKDDLFLCRNFIAGTCPKSDIIVLEERADSVQVGCKTCRSGRVVVLPEGRKKARYENQLAAIKRRNEAERDAERIKFFGQAGV